MNCQQSVPDQLLDESKSEPLREVGGRLRGSSSVTMETPRLAQGPRLAGAPSRRRRPSNVGCMRITSRLSAALFSGGVCLIPQRCLFAMSLHVVHVEPWLVSEDLGHGRDSARVGKRQSQSCGEDDDTLASSQFRIDFCFSESMSRIYL